MSDPIKKNDSKKKRKTPAEIARFAVDMPPLPTLSPARATRRAKVGRKVVVKLIEKVRGL